MSKYDFPTARFDSELVTRAFELERLRGNFGVTASTPPDLLVALHQLFQLLMSVVSARIEGNRTTVYDAIRDSTKAAADDGAREIQNLMRAVAFIDASSPEEELTHAYVRELHRISVEGLEREGDPTPGAYRQSDVQISKSAHQPPTFPLVHAEMTDWLEFARSEQPTSHQMIHVAIAHHRFLWIHPFTNGNGRVSRLLSYAMLKRHGFVSPVGLRAVNPASVFGNDRDGYYSALSSADALDNDGSVEWCTFFVRGIHEDLKRLTLLQDHAFVRDELLLPAINRLQRSGVITKRDGDALRVTAIAHHVRAGDLEGALPGTASTRSHAIRELIRAGFLEPLAPNARTYRLHVLSESFAPVLITQLDKLGFLPNILREDQL